MIFCQYWGFINFSLFLILFRSMSVIYSENFYFVGRNKSSMFYVYWLRYRDLEKNHIMNMTKNSKFQYLYKNNISKSVWYALRIRSLVWTVEVCEIRSDGVTRVGSRGGQVTDRSWWCGSGWFHTPKSSPLLKRCVGRRSMKRVGDLPRRPEKTQPPSARTTGHNDWNLRLLLLP